MLQVPWEVLLEQPQIALPQSLQSFEENMPMLIFTLVQCVTEILWTSVVRATKFIRSVI